MCSPTDCRRHPDLVRWERLADEITQLASDIHAATCRWLTLVAEFDKCGAWAQWGCRSCSHWVSWYCSIAPVAAREHVRVARRLQELPGIRGAFADGRLSYSKVRALSRVENIESEDELLALAENASAAQLERIVRAYRGVVARDRIAAGGPPDRFVTWHHDDDGALVLRARLPAEEGALVLAALEAAAASAEAAPDAANGKGELAPPDEQRCASAEASPPEAENSAGAGASSEAFPPEAEIAAGELVPAGDERGDSA
jgi:hypothetical protein